MGLLATMKLAMVGAGTGGVPGVLPPPPQESNAIPRMTDAIFRITCQTRDRFIRNSHALAFALALPRTTHSAHTNADLSIPQLSIGGVEEP
jgi:hypothetical protein